MARVVAWGRRAGSTTAESSVCSNLAGVLYQTLETSLQIRSDLPSPVEKQCPFLFSTDLSGKSMMSLHLAKVMAFFLDLLWEYLLFKCITRHSS